ncbi:hypothetical protein MKW92_037428 [Papaver armeniacum]|nr:hypothetical protein MKW92_037428 [Papaver armeniacum]
MRFVNFVKKVLSLRDNSDIHTLYLNGDNNGATIVDDICKWIATAVSHNVQELTIMICIDEDFFEIPACLCTCKSLTKLELVLGTLWADECKVILPCAMNLPRIKSLGLRFFYQLIGEEKLANKFFSDFPTQRSLDRDSRRLNKVNLNILSLPNLESLVTRDCGFDDLNLNISFPKLKYFVLNDFKPNGEIENTGEYKLYAPSLASFVLKGYMPTSFTLENLSSLVKADMRIWIKREDIGDGVFPEIRAEKKEYYTQLTLRFLRGFHNVKVLTLNGSFLKALGPQDSFDPVYPFYDEHLKFVKIKYLRGRAKELNLVATLLKHSMVLNKVILCSSCLNKYHLKEKEEEMEKFREMLLTFPRASANVVISYSVSVWYS